MHFVYKGKKSERTLVGVNSLEGYFSLQEMTKIQDHVLNDNNLRSQSKGVSNCSDLLINL